jgi:hypothetical protein
MGTGVVDEDLDECVQVCPMIWQEAEEGKFGISTYRLA